MRAADRQEQPLFKISPSSGLYFMGIVFIFLITLPFFVFCVTLPVLMTGKISAVWPSDSSMRGELNMFLMSFILYLSLPTSIPLFRVGHYVFYENKLKIKSYLLRKIYIFNYDEIHVLVRSKNRIIISKNPLPEWMESPIQRLKNEYLNGFFLTMRPNHYEDKDMPTLDLAMELLKQKSASFRVDS